MSEALPPGVLNVVSGDNALGAQLTAHPDVKKISFTGSVPTGIRVAQSAANDLKRVTLELGGNDPAIILDDVDVEAIAPQIFWSSFMNSGQICIAVKRVYAPEKLYKPLVEAVGYERALELCATTRMVGAEEAVAIGLALAVVPNDELDAKVAELTTALTANVVGAVRETKRLLQSARAEGLETQRRLEREAQARRLRELAALLTQE